MESTRTEVWPGQAYPLGATYDGIGTNFTLFSEVAERVELCLFDPPDPSLRSRRAAPRERISMTEQTDNVWHVYLPGAQPGLQYGYERIVGPHADIGAFEVGAPDHIFVGTFDAL